MARSARKPGRPRREGGPDPVRSFRMGAVFDKAEQVAAERNEKIRDVIERLLAAYVDGPRR